jgi:hypothetical protein
MIVNLLRLAGLFSLLSMLAFGGGAGVIPDMQRAAVDRYQWVTAGQFLDMFAISRAAPGPGSLIVVLIGLKVAGLLGAAVSMKFTPWSWARATMRAAVGSSAGPPNIILPRHSGETFSPLVPKERYSMLPLPIVPSVQPSAEPLECRDGDSTRPTQLALAVHQLSQHRHDEFWWRPGSLDQAGGRTEAKLAR